MFLTICEHCIHCRPEYCTLVLWKCFWYSSFSLIQSLSIRSTSSCGCDQTDSIPPSWPLLPLPNPYTHRVDQNIVPWFCKSVLGVHHSAWYGPSACRIILLWLRPNCPDPSILTPLTPSEPLYPQSGPEHSKYMYCTLVLWKCFWYSSLSLIQSLNMRSTSSCGCDQTDSIPPSVMYALQAVIIWFVIYMGKKSQW